MKKEEMEELHTLEEERVKLTKVKMELEILLRQKRLYEGGRMLGPVEYNKRRDAALRRLSEVTLRQVEINAQRKALKQLRNETLIAARGLDVHDPTSLLSHSFNLFIRLKGEGVDFDEQETRLIDALSHYLAHVRAE